MKKILVVLGTRPEAIKLAPVIGELRRRSSEFETQVCVTAQHREMLDQVLRLFGIGVEHDLDLMLPNQSVADVTCAVLQGVRGVLERERPAWVLVQGDTTTTMAAALAAYYVRIPVGHVEAGLRTQDKYAPFPEEINRRVTSVIADLHFAPTESARANLVREGVAAERIAVTGNTVIDALREVRERLHDDAALQSGLAAQFSFLNPGKRLVVVTGHRRESFGEGFRKICEAIKELVTRHPEIELLYPVHLNPNVREPVRRILGAVPGVRLLEPLDYLPFVYLLERAHLVLTDSGGVQEEAAALGKYVLVLRDATERQEAVEAGTARLVGTDKARILKEADRFLSSPEVGRHPSGNEDIFGDGRAAVRIVEALGCR